MSYLVFNLAISFLMGVLLFLGGLGIEVELVQYLGLLTGVLFFAAIWLINGKIKFPRGTYLYLAFLALFAISIVWSRDQLETLNYFNLFLAGGLFWLVFYNLRTQESFFNIDNLIVGLGIIFGALFIYFHYFGETQIKWRSLFLPYTVSLNHNNIGDYWAVVLPVVSYHLLKKPKNVLFWLLFASGIYFLVMSQSRSAAVSLVAGFAYLLKDRLQEKKYRRFLSAFIAFVIFLFLFMGLGKTTIFARPYYFQAVAGIIKNPFGIGMGNFSLISNDPVYHLFGFSGYSLIVHNILLEILVGMGVLGLTFVVWFLQRLLEVWRMNDSQKIVYGAAFFAIAGNFFFHSTYFIPTMLWLWFMILGLAQSNSKSDKVSLRK